MAREFESMAEQGLSLDDLLSGTFQSVLNIEQRALNSRFTQGLTISDIHTIVAIGLYEKNPMSVAATRLGVTLATLTTAINKLEKLGYVTRERCADDRRKVLLALTKEGRKVYRAHHLFHEQMIAEALSELTEEEERVLAVSLSKIKQFFDERA